MQLTTYCYCDIRAYYVAERTSYDATTVRWDKCYLYFVLQQVHNITQMIFSVRITNLIYAINYNMVRKCLCIIYVFSAQYMGFSSFSFDNNNNLRWSLLLEIPRPAIAGTN